MILSFLQQIFSEEITKTIISNIVGGILALLGGYFSIKWQGEQQQKERSNSYRNFYLEQFNSIRSQIDELSDILNSNGFVSFQHVEQLIITFELVNKHADGMIFIEDKAFRNELRKFFFDTFFDARRARYQQELQDKHSDELKIAERDQRQDIEAIRNQISETSNTKREYVLKMKERAINLAAKYGPTH
jgi:hypothetical protein